MFITFKSMSRSRLGLFILVGVFVANALVGLANFGIPTKDTFVAQVEVFSNLTGDDLAVAGGCLRMFTFPELPAWAQTGRFERCIPLPRGCAS